MQVPLEVIEETRLARKLSTRAGPVLRHHAGPLCYNLILTSVRDRTFLYYVLYRNVRASSASTASRSNTWPNRPVWANVAVLLSTVGLICMLVFTRRSSACATACSANSAALASLRRSRSRCQRSMLGYRVTILVETALVFVTPPSPRARSSSTGAASGRRATS